VYIAHMGTSLGFGAASTNLLAIAQLQRAGLSVVTTTVSKLSSSQEALPRVDGAAVDSAGGWWNRLTFLGGLLHSDFRSRHLGSSVCDGSIERFRLTRVSGSVV
jgi:hypothetical protein